MKFKVSRSIAAEKNLCRRSATIKFPALPVIGLVNALVTAESFDRLVDDLRLLRRHGDRRAVVSARQLRDHRELGRDAGIASSRMGRVRIPASTESATIGSPRPRSTIGGTLHKVVIIDKGPGLPPQRRKDFEEFVNAYALEITNRSTTSSSLQSSTAT